MTEDPAALPVAAAPQPAAPQPAAPQPAPEPAPGPEGGRGGYPAGQAWRWRAGAGAVAALAALAYFWAISRDPLEGYYAAAVRSMSGSWHDFIFGAFDPAGTVTLDKLPGAFWIQALSVRAFGLHTWSIAAPQAVEGVLTVLVLYRAVRRLAGPAAGLLAAVIIAASPATVALSRGNISDSLMILLVVLAADAVSAALARGSQAWLILAGAWVGLAFQAKMIEAWLLLPALGLAYLIAAPGPALRRARQLVVAGAVTGLVSLAWIAAVSLVPAAHRPYVDGSTSDSVTQMVFSYNGFGRLGDQTPLQLLQEQSLGINVAGALTDQPPGAGRLLSGDLGRDAGWLLLPALLMAAWGLLADRRAAPRGDPLRALYVLWGAWLVTLLATFSAATTINAYYTAALSPAVAAILGAGAVRAWARRREARFPLRAGVMVLAAVTAGDAALLLASGHRVPGWVIPAVLLLGVAATALALASVPDGSTPLLAAALGVTLLGGLAGPVAASAAIVARGQGSFDTPFEAPAAAAAIRQLFVRAPAEVRPLIPPLRRVQLGAPDLLAAQSSALASVFIFDSGQEALPIGGFTGTIPSPTLARLKADIADGTFHLAIMSARPSRDPRLRYIAAHCRPAPSVNTALRTYFCLPPGTRPGL